MIMEENNKIHSLEEEIKRLTDFNSTYLRDKNLDNSNQNAENMNEQYLQLEQEYDSLLSQNKKMEGLKRLKTLLASYP